MTAINWNTIYKKYKGLWVALAQDEKTVLAVAKTAKEAFDKAKKAGYGDPILTKMPQKLISYIGSAL
ncbi:MAG: DUF5678 domain-containing protein [Candidatus Levyibacteriota bacterium]